jgi:hypothetical protein
MHALRASANRMSTQKKGPDEPGRALENMS